MQHIQPSASSVSSRNRDYNNHLAKNNNNQHQHQSHTRIDQQYHFHVTEKPTSSVKNMNRNPKSIVCNSSGIIVAEMVYRCLMCRTVFETPLDCRTHFKCFHGEHYGKLLSTFSQSTKQTGHRGSISESQVAARPTSIQKSIRPKHSTTSGAVNASATNNNNNDKHTLSDEISIDQTARNELDNRTTSVPVETITINSDIVMQPITVISESDNHSKPIQDSEELPKPEEKTTIENIQSTENQKALSIHEQNVTKLADSNLIKPLVVRTSSRSKGHDQHDNNEQPRATVDEETPIKPTHRFPQRVRQTRARLYSP